MESALWNILGYGLLPLWLAAGGADWLCHRRTNIERTSGPRESQFHVALFLQIAVPALLALWLEITAAMLVLMLVGVLAHLFTSWWDTNFAQPRRHIAPIEQLVHSWLEMLPVFALVIVVLLHAGELLEPRWSLSLRETRVSTVWSGVIVTGFALGFSLILEEWWRARRASR